LEVSVAFRRVQRGDADVFAFIDLSTIVLEVKS
jgi:hypothetical protein